MYSTSGLFICIENHPSDCASGNENYGMEQWSFDFVWGINRHGFIIILEVHNFYDKSNRKFENPFLPILA